MGRQKIKQLTLSTLSITIFSILLIVMFLFWMSYRFLQPFPPKTLIMATGMAGGSYATFGELYQQALARNGIHVILHPTAGAVENLRLLKDRSQGVKVGFVQGTVGSIEESSNLVSIGGLAYTPLWIFYKGKDTYDDLTQLQGKRIAIGPEGSGVRKYSLELLKFANVTSPPTEFFDLPYAEANKALFEGKVDVAMTFGTPDNRLIWELLNAKNIKLMSIGQAEAYTRRFLDLSHVVLPRGIIDPGRRNPLSDVHLLSPTTNLIVHKDLHPALVYLLLKASVENFGGASWVNKAGEFPTLIKQDDPISEQARRFYKTGGSWLYAYMPFWVAAFAERLTLILIPLGMIIVPLIGIAPWIYTWRNRSKYYPWYRELRKLEKEILENQPIKNTETYEARLNRIEDAVNNIHMSIAFYDELFILEEHIQIVRMKLDVASK
ncbi:MAG: C4-dicarboxylate ABC transporter substrate-binding protein [Proteobacteria bacterium]|nr:C4-dicarboxylate ABC transporter substrate-binding protein [Pseudomonadota bacterium]